jgi:hypothetical protein
VRARVGVETSGKRFIMKRLERKIRLKRKKIEDFGGELKVFWWKGAFMRELFLNQSVSSSSLSLGFESIVIFALPFELSNLWRSV